MNLLSVLGLSTNQVLAQTAEIKESQQAITTYPFGDPDSVPVLERSGRGKLYPYFKYEGYSSEFKEEKWTVVDKENDYIKVSILPEVERNKSYLVLGKYTNHSGAYYHNTDFGYGHWSLYDQMP